MSAIKRPPASLEPRLEMVVLLVENGADVNLELKTGRYGTALIAAVTDSMFSPERDDALDILEYLLKQGARVNAQPTVGGYGSALVAAAHRSDAAVVKLLIDQGADVNLPLRCHKPPC